MEISVFRIAEEGICADVPLPGPEGVLDTTIIDIQGITPQMGPPIRVQVGPDYSVNYRAISPTCKASTRQPSGILANRVVDEGQVAVIPVDTSAIFKGIIIYYNVITYLNN